MDQRALCLYLFRTLSLLGEEEDAAALLDLRVAKKPLFSFLSDDIMHFYSLLNTVINTSMPKITYLKLCS